MSAHLSTCRGFSNRAKLRVNQDYLVPYRTAFLLYFTVRVAITWTVFTMGPLTCEACCDGAGQQRLKDTSVYPESSVVRCCCQTEDVSMVLHSSSGSIRF